MAKSAEEELVLGESEVEEIAERARSAAEEAPEAQHLPAVRATGRALATATPAISVDELIARRTAIKDAMERAMEDGVHFGKIPGIDKPTLLKPGAEMLCNLFALAPTFPADRRILTRYDDGHMDVDTTCVLVHIESSLVVAEGVGFCTTREKKYAYRGGVMICPECNQASVKKGKSRDRTRDQFYCYRKIGGCGATWDEGTEQFDVFQQATNDQQNRVANPDLPDTLNTVVKMSAKRSFVAAVLNATGASDVFTQDVEDTQPADRGGATEEQAQREQPRDTPVAIGEVLSELPTYVEDGKPWVKEALESFYPDVTELGRFSDLSREVQYDSLRRLGAVVLELRAQSANGFNFAGDPAAQDVVRRAFAQAFDGLVVSGPDPFQPAVPF